MIEYKVIGAEVLQELEKKVNTLLKSNSYQEEWELQGNITFVKGRYLQPMKHITYVIGGIGAW